MLPHKQAKACTLNLEPNTLQGESLPAVLDLLISF
jgi:hypothetical protein